MTASPTKGLRNDFSWKFTPAIAEWEHGDFTYDLVEVSHAQASKIIEYFRGSGVWPARGLWLGDGCAG